MAPTPEDAPVIRVVAVAVEAARISSPDIVPPLPATVGEVADELRDLAR